MMAREDDTFRKVLDGINKTKGLTQAQREEATRRAELGRKQAKQQREREERASKLRKRRLGHGDDVIDTGMFR